MSIIAIDFATGVQPTVDELNTAREMARSAGARLVRLLERPRVLVPQGPRAFAAFVESPYRLGVSVGVAVTVAVSVMVAVAVARSRSSRRRASAWTAT